jgi:hypothetical protein
MQGQGRQPQALLQGHMVSVVSMRRPTLCLPHLLRRSCRRAGATNKPESPAGARPALAAGVRGGALGMQPADAPAHANGSAPHSRPGAAAALLAGLASRLSRAFAAGDLPPQLATDIARTFPGAVSVR